MFLALARASTLACGLVLATGAHANDSAPLTPQDLARCAAQVETLRADSSALTQRNAEYETRRNALNARTAELKLERDAVNPDDLDTGLAVRAKLNEQRERTLAFNSDVAKLRTDLKALNALKQDYDARCANRSYRRADLDAMPPATRDAMRAGLGGVAVPYLAE